jgi:N-acetylneuraminic acid mutarotase
VPGCRSGAVSWTDSSGNFWLFGGAGFLSPGAGQTFNDLWKFDPTTNLWTWVSGSSTGNQLGVYGSQGIPAATNVPGARSGSVSWTDSSGDFWLFGGIGPTSASAGDFLNDLWKFDPTTNLWTWVSGSSTGHQSGVYGTKGIPSATNVPGARIGSVSWIDGNGTLWLLGGDGYDANGKNGILNDLWEFNPATNLWTWVNGSNTLPTSGGQPGIYGTEGVPAAGNVPGAREGAAGWIDSSGDLWLFGGEGYDSNGVGGQLNDLWRYQP